MKDQATSASIRGSRQQAIESAEETGNCVRNIVYEQKIKLLRGIKSDVPTKKFMRMGEVVTPDRVLRIIAAPGLQLRDHSDLPKADFLLGPNGARRLIVHDKVCDGDAEPIVLSDSDRRDQISSENVWITIAKAQGTFETLRGSLGDAPKRQKAQRDAVIELAPALRMLVRKIDIALPIRGEDIEALSHLARAISPDVDSLARDLKKQAKRAPQALKLIVKTLRQAFEKLYGMEATGSANSPFLRFADTFLREGACAYAPETIQEAFYRPDTRVRSPRRRLSKGHR